MSPRSGRDDFVKSQDPAQGENKVKSREYTFYSLTKPLLCE